MKKNILVAGCGYWGKNLVRNFYEINSLYAVCDPNEELANKFSNEYDVKSLSFNDILLNNEIEGVVLAVPAPLHAKMAIDALNSNKHVYVEKPLAMNQDEAFEMIKIAKKNEMQMMVGHLLQYHPVFIKLREMVKNDFIGKLDYVYSNRLSFGKLRSEEDVIWSFAPHDISMILSLVSTDHVTVRAESSSIIQDDIADKSIIHLNFCNGLKSHIFVSWLHPHKEHKLVAIGKQGMLVFDDSKPWSEKLSYYNHKVDISSSPELLKSELEYIDVSESEPLKNECKHFKDIVNKNIKPFTDGLEGLNVLNVLSAASESLEKNMSIKVNL